MIKPSATAAQTAKGPVAPQANAAAAKAANTTKPFITRDTINRSKSQPVRILATNALTPNNDITATA